MKRRNLLSFTALGTATAALTACQTEVSTIVRGSKPSPLVEWQMATSWPTTLDTLYGTAQYVAERVSALTEKRFTIKTFVSGEMVPGNQVLDAVQAGSVQCGHTGAYYYLDKNPAFAFGTAIPFGLNARQQKAWLLEGGGSELMNQLYAEFNVLAFPAGNTGGQMGGWFKREVNTVADLKGLKMRIPGLGGAILSRLGVQVETIAGESLFLALEREVLDAAEWVGPHDDEKLGLHKVAKFYYYPGWWEPGSSFDLIINRNAWDQLPIAYQAVLQAAAAQANAQCLAQYDRLNPQALTRLVKQGTQLKFFSPAILKACQQESIAFLEEQALTDPSFQDLYRSWKTFKETIEPWHKISE